MPHGAKKHVQKFTAFVTEKEKKLLFARQFYLLQERSRCLSIRSSIGALLEKVELARRP
jgi:hypothetical protein